MNKTQRNRVKLIKKLCNSCGEINCSECPYPFDMGLNIVKFVNSNKERVNSEKLQNEYNQYLKVMEGYKNSESNTKCQHRKAKTQEAFKPINETLESAEIFCLECNTVIGYALRQIKAIPQQKPKITIITFANNKNFYKME